MKCEQNRDKDGKTERKRQEVCEKDEREKDRERQIERMRKAEGKMHSILLRFSFARLI